MADSLYGNTNEDCVRVGILGCAGIASKNIRAISKAQEARIGMRVWHNNGVTGLFAHVFVVVHLQPHDH